jgi:hypothetical protein
MCNMLMKDGKEHRNIEAFSCIVIHIFWCAGRETHFSLEKMMTDSHRGFLCNAVLWSGGCTQMLQQNLLPPLQ